MAPAASFAMRKDDVVELPEASICHRCAGRLRIKIASRKGDGAYFADLVKGLGGVLKLKHLEANPLTGSVLFIGEDIDPEKLAAHARERRLFHLIPAAEAQNQSLMHSLVQPVAGLDRSLRAVTGGKLDIPSGIFLALLGSGLYQLMRGRISAPPWYTAFWYAFGLVSMYVIEKAAGVEGARQAD
jgi:hypothetical protein